MFAIPESALSKLDTAKPTVLIADSCAGGFGVLTSLLGSLGAVNVIYLADSEFNPFGLKTGDEIQRIVRSWFELRTQNNSKIDLLIVACNTASLASLPAIAQMSEEAGIPVLTMVDAFGEMLRVEGGALADQRVGLMATRYSITNGHYQELLKRAGALEVTSITATASERAVANAFYTEPKGQADITEELSVYASESLRHMVLGCTCFKFIQNDIKSALPSIERFHDPSDHFSALALAVLGQSSIALSLRDVVFLNTGGPDWGAKMNTLAKHLWGEQVTVTPITASRSILSS